MAINYREDTQLLLVISHTGLRNIDSFFISESLALYNGSLPNVNSVTSARQ